MALPPDHREQGDDRHRRSTSAPVLDASKSPALRPGHRGCGRPVRRGRHAGVGPGRLRVAAPARSTTSPTPTAAALLGIAVTAADAGNGSWSYTPNGTTWTALGAVSDSPPGCSPPTAATASTSSRTPTSTARSPPRSPSGPGTGRAAPTAAPPTPRPTAAQRRARPQPTAPDQVTAVNDAPVLDASKSPALRGEQGGPRRPVLSARSCRPWWTSRPPPAKWIT